MKIVRKLHKKHDLHGLFVLILSQPGLRLREPASGEVIVNRTFAAAFGWSPDNIPFFLTTKTVLLPFFARLSYRYL
jgi:hypothetical protein